ncbi:MAG: hypothetical protein DVB26_05050 [Verrucomicrobia bacterium]|nr:MAG: hypothetical protein DVB26_05050 [Verrucomicrobiota bacterium]
MSDENMAWYHCGRCGLLFKSPVGDAHERRCTQCGRDPSLGVKTPPSPAPTALPATHQQKKSAGRRRPKRDFLMAKIVLGWALATALMVLAVRLHWRENKTRNPATSAVTKAAGNAGDEAVVSLNQALPACHAALGGFLSAGTPEERNQFVLNPVATAGRMARFYDLNPFVKIDLRTLKNTANSLLELPTGRAVESRFSDADGRMLDCVFVQQNGEWRLDWEHFVRYGNYPWQLFLTGAGEPELEFRLLVRERLVKQRNESSLMSLAFYQPRFGYPDQTTTASPEFLVKRDSPDGKLLAAAFTQHAKGEPLYASKLPGLEQPDMLRVRVRLRRLPAAPDADAPFSFELVKVLACHWLTLDDPGAALPPAAP